VTKKADLLKTLISELGAETQLLIVSKTRPIEDIIEYYDLGHRDFGENRVQELTQKAQSLSDRCPEIRWHLIGHLQSNKLNALTKIPNLYAIHSVHDQALLEKLIKLQDKFSKPLKIFLQVNTSGEEEKSGFESYEEVKAAALILTKASGLELLGLMTMGTLRTEAFEEEAKRCFNMLDAMRLRLQDELHTTLQTSMGMSQDYKIAISSHANWVRIGTMMFV